MEMSGIRKIIFDNEITLGRERVSALSKGDAFEIAVNGKPHGKTIKTHYEYYIGIDGGGTKTEFLLADENGKEVARLVKGGSNPNDIGIEACAAVLREGILDIAKAYEKNNLHIFAGVSGAGVGDNARIIREELSVYPHLQVASDLENAMEVCLSGQDGLAVICGTGISCSIVKKGERKTVGGYGYLFEDGGSGYGYGRDAIKAALEEEDGFGKVTVLTECLQKALGSSVRNALGEILRGGKSKVASYCPLVFEGYEQGDEVSKKIVKYNLTCTVELIKNAIQVSGIKNDKLAFIGGVSKERVFQERIKKEFGKFREIYFCEEKPVLGAVRIAMKGAKEWQQK